MNCWFWSGLVRIGPELGSDIQKLNWNFFCWRTNWWSWNQVCTWFHFCVEEPAPRRRFLVLLSSSKKSQEVSSPPPGLQKSPKPNLVLESGSTSTSHNTNCDWRLCRYHRCCYKLYLLTSWHLTEHYSLNMWAFCKTKMYFYLAAQNHNPL